MRNVQEQRPRYELTAPAFGGQLRSVDLSFTSAEEAFRSELRAWLRDHVPRSMLAASLSMAYQAATSCFVIRYLTGPSDQARFSSLQ